MSITEAVLIVCVIVLVIYIVRQTKMFGKQGSMTPAPTQNAQPAPAPQPQTVVASNGNIATTVATEGLKRKKNEGFKTYDEMAAGCLNENTEYFMAGGEMPDEAKKAMDCACGDSDGSFAKFDYGAKGLDYKEYVTSQAVDNKVIENHLQFVRDRKGLGPTGEFIQGRTYSPDSHDSYNPIPWVGLQRPQYVPVANPTQVPDVDYNLYKGRKPYCFWT